MQKTTYQRPEIRNSSDEIIQSGAYGKNTAFCNSQNNGIFDYINNNLEWLYDNSANKSELNDYLPLSGGTISGWLTFSGSPRLRHENTNSGLEIYGGTAYNNGAYLRLNGKDKDAGQFDIHAHDGTSTKVLTGKADGTLMWNGKNISLEGHTHSYLPLSGGIMSNGITIRNTDATRGETLSADSIRQVLFQDKNGTSVGILRAVMQTDGGVEVFMSAIGSNWCTISTRQNGEGKAYYRAGNKDIECVEASGTNYIRYTSGLQIAWGNIGITAMTNIVFPASFSKAPSLTVSSNGNGCCWATGLGPTSFNFQCSNYGSGIEARYIAIGRWK